MQLGSMFIGNCNIALHVSDAFCVHLQEHLETVEAAYTQYDLVWMPSILDALLDTSTLLMSLTRGCFYSCQVLLKMDAKRVRNMYSNIAVTNKHTAKIHHVGSFYIY